MGSEAVPGQVWHLSSPATVNSPRRLHALLAFFTAGFYYYFFGSQGGSFFFFFQAAFPCFLQTGLAFGNDYGVDDGS